MPETEHSQQNISAIRTRLDNLERMMRLSIASNPASVSHLKQIFGARRGAAELYMALEGGPQTQEQLIQVLGRSHATVSKICTHLYEAGIIEKVADGMNPRVLLWSWHEMERTLGISKIARQHAKL